MLTVRLYFLFGHLYIIIFTSDCFLSYFFCSCVTSSRGTSSPTAMKPSRSWATTLAVWAASLLLRHTALWENTCLTNTPCKGHGSKCDSSSTFKIMPRVKRSTVPCTVHYSPLRNKKNKYFHSLPQMSFLYQWHTSSQQNNSKYLFFSKTTVKQISLTDMVLKMAIFLCC